MQEEHSGFGQKNVTENETKNWLYLANVAGSEVGSLAVCRFKFAESLRKV